MREEGCPERCPLSCRPCASTAVTPPSLHLHQRPAALSKAHPGLPAPRAAPGTAPARDVLPWRVTPVIGLMSFTLCPGASLGWSPLKKYYVFIFGCAGHHCSPALLWPQSRGSTVHELRQSGFLGSGAQARGLSCSAVCGIFPDQRSNPCLLHCWLILHHRVTREVLFSFFSVHVFTLPEITNSNRMLPPQ